MNFPTTEALSSTVTAALTRMGVEVPAGDLEVRTPITGGVLTSVAAATPDNLDAAIPAAGGALAVAMRQCPLSHFVTAPPLAGEHAWN